MIPLKDVPAHAIPVLVFLTGAFVFGQLVHDLPDRTLLQQILSTTMGACSWLCAIMFFVKLFFDWPRTPGLHIPPHAESS
jgi:hypothetical protein